MEAGPLPSQSRAGYLRLATEGTEGRPNQALFLILTQDSNILALVSDMVSEETRQAMDVDDLKWATLTLGQDG